MADFTELVQQYLDTWNESDPAARRKAVEQLWAPTGRYIDPLVDAQGYEAIDAAIGAARELFAGLTFELLDDVDAHHNQARFRWRLGTPGHEALAVGSDVLVVGEDGRGEMILGLRDEVPPIPAHPETGARPDREGDGTSAPSYAVGLLTNVRMGDEVAEYLRRIDATLAPYDGRFLVHGSSPTEMEGRWPGELIVIEFPEADGAVAWYASDAYQAIIPLRTHNADGLVALFDGVTQPHRAADVLTGSETPEGRPAPPPR